MAKKRKKEKKEEGYEFKMPEFDEEEYLKKEVRDAKTFFITFVYAAMIAVVSFGLTFVDVAAALLVGFIAIIFLRHIYPMLGIDTSLIEKKQWAGNIIMFIFTWLAIWILLSNPPFSDSAAPNIEHVEVYYGTPGNWTKLNESNNMEWRSQNIITEGTNVSINASITDNVNVDVDTIRITIIGSEGRITPTGGDNMTRIGKNRYSYVFSAEPQREYDFTITAFDVNNHKINLSGSILF